MTKGFPKGMYGTNNSSSKVYQKKTKKVGSKRGGKDLSGTRVSKGGKSYGM